MKTTADGLTMEDVMGVLAHYRNRRAAKRNVPGMRPQSTRRGLTMYPTKLIWLSDVIEGDMLFGVGPPRGGKLTAVQRSIVGASGGPYLHVGIALRDAAGRLRIFESVGAGVRAISLWEFIRRYAYVAVWSEPSWRAGDIPAARAFAQHAVHRRVRYSKRRAIWSAWAAPRHRAKLDPLVTGAEAIAFTFGMNAFNERRLKPTFCSAFVMEVLMRLDTGFNSNVYLPAYFTPMRLATEAELSFEGFIAADQSIIDPADPGM